MGLDEAAARREISTETGFVQNAFRIINKSSQLVPFRFNRVQQLYASRKSRFDFILKARKMGISSRIIAGDLWACAFSPNQKCILVAQDDEAVSAMLEERVKPLLKNCLVPLDYKPTQEGIFFPKTQSWYRISTARKLTLGRSKDITRFHLSEFAHYDSDEILAGLEEARTDDAIGRIETTANGFNFAKKIWDTARQGKGLYKAIFFPWACDDDYRIRGAVISGMSEEERSVVELLKLDHEQIAWMREKKKTMSKPELFPQEYPAYDDEAFLSSGRMVFDSLSLLHQSQRVAEPAWVGDLTDVNGRIELSPRQDGGLRIWKQPQRLHVYIIGADVAEGIAGGAYSVGFVFDVDDQEQVAEWHGHIAPDLFADELCKLGAYYNHALIAPEAWPGPGEVTQSTVRRNGYSNLYEGEKGNGWATNARTRQEAIYNFGAALRDLQIIVKSKDLISECRSFVYDEKGNSGPRSGTFSDRVFAAMIAHSVFLEVGQSLHRPDKSIRAALGGGGLAAAVSAPRYTAIPGVRRPD